MYFPSYKPIIITTLVYCLTLLFLFTFSVHFFLLHWAASFVLYSLCVFFSEIYVKSFISHYLVPAETFKSIFLFFSGWIFFYRFLGQNVSFSLGHSLSTDFGGYVALVLFCLFLVTNMWTTIEQTYFNVNRFCCKKIKQ